MAIVLAAVVAPTAAADPRPNAVLPELWGVVANTSFRSATFTRLQRAGINTVVIDSRGLGLRQVDRLTRAAGQARLRVVQPASLPRPGTVVDARTTCNAFRSAHPGSACPLWASSLSSAVRLARSGAADLVVVRLPGPGSLRAFARAPAGRILAIVPLGEHFRARSWRSAIKEASSDATLDLAFAPRSAAQKTVSGYLKLLDWSGATSRDRRAPSNPTGLRIAQKTPTTLGLSWNASYDKRGVAGYDFYVDGALFGITTSTTYADSKLPCGSSHILAVEAFDAAGNHSAKSSLGAETSPCVLPPAIDALAPSVPGNLQVSGRTRSTIALTWSASIGDLGVAGYGLHRNNVLVGSTQLTSFTFSGLSCGTYYDLAVDAYDLSGTRSPKTSTGWQTLACPAPPPPPPPPPSPPGSSDAIAFPRIAQYNSFNWGDGSTQAHFQMNGFQGCNPGVADKSYALNPKQVNFIIPTIPVSPNGVTAGPNCGATGTGFGVSYGAYDSITSPIASPYPGIGTIRAYRGAACPFGDYACFSDNTRIQPALLNFASQDTANWGAELRAHFYQKDLSTGSHPGVHGIWGDNFAWWGPYFKSRRSAGGSPPLGPAQAWDDGSIENVSELHSLVPDALLGANGAGLACGFGNVYVGSVPGKDCTGAGDTTLWEGYGGYHYIHDPATFDSAIAQFKRWMSTPADDGHPKRGMMNVFGITGQNALGHVLTPQDQRLELAYACIGGLYAWIVNGDGWGTTAIPGTPAGNNFAIPEMGDSAAYPRGWLGLPTGTAVKVASGEWKRMFSEGTVYANATTRAWSVDGYTVPAQDGLFVKL